MRTLLHRFTGDQSGRGHRLIAALIALVIITAVTAVGTSLNTKLKAVATALS